MDKKDFKDYVKIITKIYIYLLAILAIPANLIISLIYSLTNGNFLTHFISNTISTIIAFTFLLVIVYIGIFIVLTLINKKRKKEMLITDKYIRDLPKYFPPAIASFLLDLSLETTTDYTATIAYLISKKYIELKESEVVVLNSNIDTLSSHEKYTFLCVTNRNKFNHDEFIKLVMDDAEKLNLITKGKRKIHFFRNLGISLASYIICGLVLESATNVVINNIFTILGTLSSISIFAVIAFSIYLLMKYDKENYHRTKLGEEETLKWTGVKNFLKEFTLVKEKNMSDVILLDDYIPYAIALNEAKSIEKFIEENDSYRKLIYGNISNIYK